MKETDIENIIESIHYIDKINKEIEKLNKNLVALKKNEKNAKKSIENLKYGNNKPIEKVLIKRTFREIMDEIAKENNIPKKSLFLEFDEKILGGYYFRTNETKRETIQKEINACVYLTFKFKIATNKKALEKDPVFCIYPLSKEEKERRERVKKIRESDPLYGEYRFDIKPFLPSKNGKCPIDAIRREEGICAEMAWFLNINKYDDMYYYVEPEFIDLDDESILSKTLKNMLTYEEIKEYYEQKKKNEDNESIKRFIIEKYKEQLKLYELKIENLSIKLNIKKRKVKEAKQLCPKIKIKLGDFIEELYESNETIINRSNSNIMLHDIRIKKEIDKERMGKFNLSISIHSNKRLEYYSEFCWEMSYLALMYDGKSLIEHFKNNYWRSFTKLRKIKDFILYFDPMYFFKDRRTPSTLGVKSPIENNTIRKVVLKCIALEIARQKGMPNSYANEIYEKYCTKLETESEKKVNPKRLLSEKKENKETKTNLIASQTSKDEIIKKIRRDYNTFKTLDLKYRSDKEITLEAIVMDGMLLEYVAESLKSDDNIVDTALKSKPLALKFAANKYKNDKNIVLKLVSRCPEVVEFISPILKENILIAIEAVKRNGKVLKYLPKFKNNREVVLEAVKQNGLALLSGDNKFFSDKEIMLEVIRQNQSTYLITYMSQDLKDDEEFMKEVCKMHVEYIKYASERLKDKKEFILSICDTTQECITYASERLKDEFRLELIKSYADNIFDDIEGNTKPKSKAKIRRKSK